MLNVDKISAVQFNTNTTHVLSNKSDAKTGGENSMIFYLKIIFDISFKCEYHSLYRTLCSLIHFVLFFFHFHNKVKPIYQTKTNTALKHIIYNN